MHRLSYFIDLQGSQTRFARLPTTRLLSYFIDLQGSQTHSLTFKRISLLSYFIDLQGSQTTSLALYVALCLVTLLIYKVLKLGVPKVKFISA